MPTAYIYILQCTGNRLYTGYTTDLERRWQEHVDGSPKCKFTRCFKPIRIAAAWQVTPATNSGTSPSSTQHNSDISTAQQQPPQPKSYAQKVEHYIKSLSKPAKIKLIQAPQSLQKTWQNLQVTADKFVSTQKGI